MGITLIGLVSLILFVSPDFMVPEFGITSAIVKKIYMNTFSRFVEFLWNRA